MKQTAGPAFLQKKLSFIWQYDKIFVVRLHTEATESAWLSKSILMINGNNTKKIMEVYDYVS